MEYIQQVFNVLSPPNAFNSTVAPMNVSTTAVPAQGATPPTDLSSLIALLFSFSALRDWLKLFVLGGFFESFRRFISYLYTKAVDSMFVNATFNDKDSSYDWMMAWLSKQPSWASTRSVEITTSGESSASIVTFDGDENNEMAKSTRHISYVPSLSRTYTLWYKRRWISVTRVQEENTLNFYKDYKLHISILTRDTKFLTELLKEARDEYLAAQEHNMCVYVSNSQNDWRHVATRPKRALDSVVLDPGIKEMVIEDAQDFLESKSWYSERGIPFRRGYLLYGAPGSGKTSLIHCLAGELGLDVYVISLSRSGLDDSALDQLVNDLPERCVALMEDIDAAFTHTLNRDDPGTDDPSVKKSQTSSPGATSKLSLSGLLNALDGVAAQEGRILVATTNKYSSLDPALCRPGRMDIHIEFKLASKYQCRELYKRFYLPGLHISDENDDLIDAECDSGYVSEKSEASTPPSSPNSASSLLPESEKPTVIGLRHRDRAPKLSKRQVRILAKQFANSIPEREFSMASLQGYLMTYKVRPFEAVADMEAWVEKERKDRVVKAKTEKEKAEKAAKEKKEKLEKELLEKEKLEKAKSKEDTEKKVMST
ncbi:P-loop containing nucleoside triphosphate hydrolase protein [Mycena floridula]|nr:P-loop containing nucleoside triphosphate hydrolase protein [Mycena floridula]